MIKLIVSDIDGTLVKDGENQVNPEIFDVIMELKKKKNIHFAAASGRQAASIEYTFKPIQKEIFYVAENGSYLGCYGRTLFLYPIEQKLVNELARDIRANPLLEVMVGGAKGTYLETDNQEFIDWMVHGYHFNIIKVDDVTKVDDEIIKVAAYKKEGIQESVGYLFDQYSDKLKMTISGDMWMDCMRNGVNKGEAVKTLQESLGITPEETMVFGDQLNDIEMLKCAHYSFAVGNAREEVKKTARFQADTNVNDGVMKIIKTLL